MPKQKYIIYLTKETRGWKKGGLFDVSMWVYHHAEVCKLVGNFLLEKSSEICNKSNIGLYRSDVLSILRNKSGTKASTWSRPEK